MSSAGIALTLPVGLRVSHEFSAGTSFFRCLPARAEMFTCSARHVREILLDLPLQVSTAVFVEQIPLVVGQHERAATP